MWGRLAVWRRPRGAHPAGRVTRPSRGVHFPEFLSELLEGGACLGFSAAFDVDAVLREEGLELHGELKGFVGAALRRNLEDARAVRVEPELDDDPAIEVLRNVLDPQEKGRPQRRERLQRSVRRSVG